VIRCKKCEDITSDDVDCCPTCGAELTEDRNAEPVSWSIRVRFEHSPSKYYATAVQLAEEAPNYVKRGEGENAIHLARYSPGQAPQAAELWEVIKGWASSSLQVDGEEASKRGLIYNGLHCFQKFQESGQRRDYCFGTGWFNLNPIGCTRIGISIFARGDSPADLDLEPAWNNMGRFDDDGVWHFDKEAIRNLLKRRFETNRFCPLLKWEHIEAFLDRLPDTVDPETNPDWFENDHIPGIPDSVYGLEDTQEGVVLKVSGFEKLNPFNYSPTIPHPSHEEAYIEENLSRGIGLDGKSFKDRSLAEDILERARDK